MAEDGRTSGVAIGKSPTAAPGTTPRHRVLQPAGWPPPKGYSNGMLAEGRIVVTGGVVGWTVDGVFPRGFVEQARQTFENIAADSRRSGGRTGTPRAPDLGTSRTWTSTSGPPANSESSLSDRVRPFVSSHGGRPGRPARRTSRQARNRGDGRVAASRLTSFRPGDDCRLALFQQRDKLAADVLDQPEGQQTIGHAAGIAARGRAQVGSRPNEPVGFRQHHL